MKKYPYLTNLLSSVFSAEVGLDEIEEMRLFKKTLKNKVVVAKLKEELLQLFEDKDISWVGLLDNDQYVVLSAEDDSEARQFIIDNIWKYVASEADSP